VHVRNVRESSLHFEIFMDIEKLVRLIGASSPNYTKFVEDTDSFTVANYGFK
ncbi:40456_t:CDS:2, partial [Gigaspora margarita]